MFRMRKCRGLLSRTNEEFGLIQSLLEHIERAVSENSNGVFCLCYSMIDTTCKTILRRYGIPDSEKDDLQKRFRVTLRRLSLFPPEYETDNKKDDGVPRVLQGLVTAVLGLCNLRNKDGIISHGKHAAHEPYDLLQIQFAADTTDTIASYLLQAYLDYPPPVSDIIYDDQKYFNEYVDVSHDSIMIFGQVFLPSKILYLYDSEHSAYREALEQFQEIEPDLAEVNA